MCASEFIASYRADADADAGTKPMPHTVLVAIVKQPINYWPLADKEVCHVGVPVAVVVADRRSAAEDAAALVEIEYEPVPAVVDRRKALDAAAPHVRLDTPDNVVACAARSVRGR